MKSILACLVVTLAVASATVPANAKGCIKGAVIGGIAGHYAGHHGLLGAAAGCIIGHMRQRSTRGRRKTPRLTRRVKATLNSSDRTHRTATPANGFRTRPGARLFRAPQGT